jgi:hypothetical protein
VGEGIGLVDFYDKQINSPRRFPHPNIYDRMRDAVADDIIKVFGRYSEDNNEYDDNFVMFLQVMVWLKFLDPITEINQKKSDSGQDDTQTNTNRYDFGDHIKSIAPVVPLPVPFSDTTSNISERYRFNDIHTNVSRPSPTISDVTSTTGQYEQKQTSSDNASTGQFVVVYNSLS